MLIQNLQKNLFEAWIKNVTVINPGCNYPIPINEEAKEFAKNIYGNASPKLITISRLDGRKSHQNVMMTIKKSFTKISKFKICFNWRW